MCIKTVGAEINFYQSNFRDPLFYFLDIYVQYVKIEDSEQFVQESGKTAFSMGQSHEISELVIFS